MATEKVFDGWQVRTSRVRGVNYVTIENEDLSRETITFTDLEWIQIVLKSNIAILKLMQERASNAHSEDKRSDD